MIAIFASCKVHPKNAFETRCIESAEVIPKKVAKDEDFHFAASGVESSAFFVCTDCSESVLSWLQQFGMCCTSNTFCIFVTWGKRAHDGDKDDHLATQIHWDPTDKAVKKHGIRRISPGDT